MFKLNLYYKTSLISLFYKKISMSNAIFVDLLVIKHSILNSHSVLLTQSNKFLF